MDMGSYIKIKYDRMMAEDGQDKRALAIAAEGGAVLAAVHLPQSKAFARKSREVSKNWSDKSSQVRMRRL